MKKPVMFCLFIIMMAALAHADRLRQSVHGWLGHAGQADADALCRALLEKCGINFITFTSERTCANQFFFISSLLLFQPN